MVYFINVMIINTGMRTDIPAFYSEWLMNRIRAGYVLVRNPYYRDQVTKYNLSPDAVDILAFCSKNPEPMLKHMEELKAYRQFWFVTITPYGREIEENVPDKESVISTFRQISGAVGPKAMSWRYDPVFVTEKYSVSFHAAAFESMAEKLEGYTTQAVISFIDLYSKTRRNFPEAEEVTRDERFRLAEAFVRSGEKHGITIRSCCEGEELASLGVDVSGCMTKSILEAAIEGELILPKRKSQRQECGCFMGNDIGAYNTCAHFCRYCYANYDREVVERNMGRHDPESPFLIGNSEPGDIMHEAPSASYATGQMRLDLTANT